MTDPSPEQIAAGRTVLLAADLAHVFWSQDAAAADEIVRMVFEAMTAAAPTADATVRVFTQACDSTDIARDIASRLQRYRFVPSAGDLPTIAFNTEQIMAMDCINRGLLSVEELRHERGIPESVPESPPIGSDAAADWERDVADVRMQKGIEKIFYTMRNPGESREDFDKRRKKSSVLGVIVGASGSIE